MSYSVMFGIQGHVRSCDNNELIIILYKRFLIVANYHPVNILKSSVLLKRSTDNDIVSEQHLDMGERHGPDTWARHLGQTDVVFLYMYIGS